MRWILASVAASVLVAASAFAGTHTTTARNGLIVLQGKHGSKTVIYVVNPDGSGLRAISTKGAYSGEPDWSPSGKTIAFTTSRSGEGTLSIYLMNADGSGARRLGFDPGDAHDPAWSPNGRQIAFAGTGINLMFEDGSIVRRITAELPLRSPTWSPDGRKLAFSSGPNERLSAAQIYVVQASGTGLKQLTNNPGGAAQPSWSPDGSRIAFVAGASDLYVMSADGSHKHRLTFTTAPEMSPAWSPDGRWLVFGRGKPRRSLFLIPAAGGKPHVLVTASGASFDQPDWQRLP